MAKQKSIFSLEGTIGGVTFYKSKDGYLAREKGGIDKNRMATDPAFQRTRENQAEFGRACSANKYLRLAFKSLLGTISDKSVSGRLTQAIMRVLKADSTNSRGSRNILHAELEMLKGFDFNLNGPLATTFFAPFSSSLDRAAGTGSISIPPFIPQQLVAVPNGATHFKLNAGGAAIDFTSGSYEVNGDATGYLPADNLPTASISLGVSLPAASVHPLFLSLGIEFVQEVNGSMYTLKNGAYNGLALVEVSSL